MKKTLIFIFVLILNFVFCQEQFYAEYSLTKFKNGYKFKARGILSINYKNQSNFILSQYKNLLSNDNVKNPYTFIANDNVICYDNKVYFSDYTSMTNRFLLFENDCNNKTIVVEKIQIPNWKIYPAKNSILKKAEAIINDRKWIVYFNPKIKVKANPWRFYGINGLIVKAEDKNKEYIFELVKFKDNFSEILSSDIGNYPESNFLQYKKLTISDYNKNIKRNVSKIAANETALNKFISKIPPYECLEFIEKK